MRRKWLRVGGKLALILLSCLAGILVLWFGLPALLDSPAPDPWPDPRREIPDERNILAGLAAACEAYGEPSLAPGPREDFVAAVEAAMERPDFAWPLTEAGKPSRGDMACRHGMRVLADRGGWQGQVGATAAAAETFLRLSRVTSKASGAVDDLWALFNVLACANVLYAQAVEALDDAWVLPDQRRKWRRWTAEDVAAWRQVLESMQNGPDFGQAASDALAGEFYSFREHQQRYRRTMRREWLRHLPSSLLSFGPNPEYLPGRTEAQAAEVYAHLRELAVLPGWQRDQVGFSKPRVHGLTNRYGQDLLIGWLPDGREFRHVDRARAYRRLAVTAIAARLYLETHHVPPQTLTELVDAGLLRTVPLDPFDGQPLRYRPRLGIVYALGKDQTDDGGRPGTGGGGSDIVAELPFLTLQAPSR